MSGEQLGQLSVGMPVLHAPYTIILQLPVFVPEFSLHDWGFYECISMDCPCVWSCLYN